MLLRKLNEQSEKDPGFRIVKHTGYWILDTESFYLLRKKFSKKFWIFPVYTIRERGFIMVRHIVMWNLKGDKEKNGKTVVDKFMSMQGKIKEIQSIEVKLGFKSPYSSHDIVLITSHASKEDYLHYQEHPYHKEIKEFVPPYLYNRACLDMES